MNSDQSINILRMSKIHVAQVAQMHIESIKEGFISSLGHKFVSCLYQGVVESDNSFGFVAVRNGMVLGFVACSENTKELYKKIIKKKFFKLLWLYLPRILSFSNILKSIQTLLYPSKDDKSLPRAELLAIAVFCEQRGLGIGKKLVEASCHEYKRRGIKVFKAIVFELFESNHFYQNAGFELVTKYAHHGQKDIHNVYIKKTEN